jgi:hypothetical protein
VHVKGRVCLSIRSDDCMCIDGLVTRAPETPRRPSNQRAPANSPAACNHLGETCLAQLDGQGSRATQRRSDAYIQHTHLMVGCAQYRRGCMPPHTVACRHMHVIDIAPVTIIDFQQGMHDGRCEELQVQFSRPPLHQKREAAPACTHRLASTRQRARFVLSRRRPMPHDLDR